MAVPTVARSVTADSLPFDVGGAVLYSTVLSGRVLLPSPLDFGADLFGTPQGRLRAATTKISIHKVVGVAALERILISPAGLALQAIIR